MFGEYVPLRTHFIDDSLETAIEEGITQAVVLGAGLDGRAYRLAWSAHTRLVELDTTEMREFKQTVANRAEMIPRVELIPVHGRPQRRLARSAHRRRFQFSPANRLAH